MTGSSAPTEYQAARVVLLDDDDRVLLLEAVDPAAPEVRFWLTPGGGIEPGETAEQAARRELREETGCPSAVFGPQVWSDVAEFDFLGERVRQHQRYFAARVPSWEIRDTTREAVEQASILGYRWWTRDELHATDQEFYPRELPDLLSRLTADLPAGRGS